MTGERSLVLVALVVLVVLLLRGRAAPSAVFGGTALGFILFGMVPLDSALLHLVNPGLVTVVLLLMLGSVLDRAQWLERAAIRLCAGSFRGALARIIGLSAVLSAFLNNTAVVAALLGPLKASTTHQASRLLMPMCFAASLGGVLTLIGTSTNLLINGLWVARGQAPLGIFDLLPVGLAVLGVCALAMLVLYPRLLPATEAANESTDEYVIEALVRSDSSMVGRKVVDAGLRRLVHLYLAEIVRDGHIIAPVDPEEVVHAGDRLVFCGDATRIDLLLRLPGLVPQGDQSLANSERLTEVVLTPESALRSQSLREADFRGRYDAAVVAMRRGGRRLAGGLGDLPLAAGDSLMLVTGPDFETRSASTNDFLVLRQQQLRGFSQRWREISALGAFGGVIVGAAAGLFSLQIGLLVLLAGFVAAKFVRASDLRRYVPFEIIIVISSALVISDVMAHSGVATMLASGLLTVSEGLGPVGALAAILVLTWLLTELMSNNAAAALMFPVAWDVSAQLDLQPLTFVMAVLYGASCSFMTPYGYQTNLMVMGPGRYVLADYLRCGSPIALAYCATALVVLPLAFPLR